MTPAALRFLRDLVAQQQISAAHPDLVEVATLIRNVLAELDTAIKETEQ